MPLPKLQFRLRLKDLPASKRVKLRANQGQQLQRGKNTGRILGDDMLRLEAIKLRCEEHLTYPQIAERQNCSLSTAHARVNGFWSELIENIVELQIQQKADVLTEIETMKQQIRPYIVNPDIDIRGISADGRVIQVERWRAMNAAIDRMVKLCELQLKVAGITNGAPETGEGIGQQSLTDAVIKHIAAYIIGNTVEKKATAREVR